MAKPPPSVRVYCSHAHPISDQARAALTVSAFLLYSTILLVVDCYFHFMYLFGHCATVFRFSFYALLGETRLKFTSLTHLAFKRLVSDSQLHVRTRFAAALLCRLSGRVGRKKDETCASARAAHHCATQCKGATDGHHNYMSRRCCFIFPALHQATRWRESGAAQRRQRRRTS